ncbi:hypothetical protein VNO77_19414 [Canavalia gladiata]|uniref:Uncharacterized protein n=1 Tax=Canavalia gladiata TaxID=3824 RepID=A0AAN9LSI9_CANGL
MFDYIRVRSEQLEAAGWEPFKCSNAVLVLKKQRCGGRTTTGRSYKHAAPIHHGGEREGRSSPGANYTPIYLMRLVRVIAHKLQSTEATCNIHADQRLTRLKKHWRVLMHSQKAWPSGQGRGALLSPGSILPTRRFFSNSSNKRSPWPLPLSPYRPWPLPLSPYLYL